jgi:signal transduction histidine kinase
MHRLFFKIFLWFWLGIVAVSGTLVTLTELTHSRAADDQQWQDRYGPRVDMWARQEVDILRVEGAAALEKYVKSFQTDRGGRNYIFDEAGREVLGRQAPKEVMEAVASISQSPPGRQQFVPGDRIVAETIVSQTGQRYVVVVDFPQPSLLSRSLFEFLFADVSQAVVVRFFAVVLVAGVLCFWLARQIVTPIDRLRLATREIANEHLQTRVDKRVLTRGDELADLGYDFDRMATRIESLVTAHRHFLADVSHALRSPLARLNVALGLVRRRIESKAASEHLDRIERETDRLNTLIGQLLTMARLDSGVDLERKSAFDLGLLVDEVAADADYEARGRRCAVKVSHSCECIVEGAREMLRGAVENVVRNAVRHTAGSTTVDIALSSRPTDHGPVAVIQVGDHGPGVSEDAIGSLFTPFRRIMPNPSPDGTGLGLAITKRTLEVHGGSVSAANAPEGGLVVTLELPALKVVNLGRTVTEGEREDQRDRPRVAMERRHPLRAV